MTIYLSVSEDNDAYVRRCAEVFDALGFQALERDGRFVVSLAGGETPREVYAGWAKHSRLPWSKVVLLFGDEHCLTEDKPGSNHQMVQESLLENLGEQPQVLRMEGENTDAAQAALAYEAQLREVLGSQGRVHLTLLGLSPGGETASLFRGSEAVKESDRLCVVTTSPGGGERLTLTVPFLRRSHKIFFLASGSQKAEIVKQVLEGRLSPEEYPAQFFLRDDRLNVNLLLDRDAASQLTRIE
ncbi:MAG: 6-phosphogluconolactonase [Deltaproteobacteria bacterium]|nr:6-phosphogluconolactonase [Deltaproteobacteria bacterium]